jgi:uncharacterized LabA/DUF88 family protein
MEKVFIFNDFANSDSALKRAGMHDNYYADLLEYLAEGRQLVEAHAFVPVDPYHPSAMDRSIHELWNSGYLVHDKLGAPAGESYKCDFDVEIALEMRDVAEIARPDIVVLISGDKDLVPIVLNLRRRGIRVEVAAFPGINAAREIMTKSSGFINLHGFLEWRRNIDESFHQQEDEHFVMEEQQPEDETI